MFIHDHSKHFGFRFHTSHAQLRSVAWQLNLQLAQSKQAKMKVPNAVFEFRISQPGSVRCFSTTAQPLTDLEQTQSKTENVHAEFTHDQLFKFYEQVCFS